MNGGRVGAAASGGAAGRTAAIVLSGDELLDGRTRDTNGAVLTRDLAGLGVRVVSLALVADERETLSAALRCALDRRPDLLLIGGGLGTTHDDLTAECLADVLGVPLVEHAAALDMLRERVAEVSERRRLDAAEVFERARRQARLPAGAAPLPPAGLAPGIAATSGDTRVFAFPGVPWELDHMWRAVRDGLERDGFFPPVVARLVRIYGAGELQVSPIIEGCECDRLWVGVNVGAGEVVVIVRHHVADEPASTQADQLVERLSGALPVFSDDGRTVDALLAGTLRAHGHTVAVAESCTGGLLGARLTERPGSSDYMLGGVIGYADEVKATLLGVSPAVLSREGAVSEPVAAAMAEGVRRATGATWGLAVTGIAGPEGGTPEKPVGLVYVACAGPGGTRATRNLFPGDRSSVREWSVVRALHLLREELAR
jgi:nicotinamide-nucleotide amidase